MTAAAVALLLALPMPWCTAVDPVANVAVGPWGSSTYVDQGDALAWSRWVPGPAERLAQERRGRAVRVECGP